MIFRPLLYHGWYKRGHFFNDLKKEINLTGDFPDSMIYKEKLCRKLSEREEQIKWQTIMENRLELYRKR